MGSNGAGLAQRVLGPEVIPSPRRHAPVRWMCTAAGVVSVTNMDNNRVSAINDPIIERALGELTSHNDLLTHDDRDIAIQTLRLLRDRGHDLNPEAIEAWALARSADWSVNGARRLREFAEGVLRDHQYRITTLPLVDDACYERWSSPV